MRGKMLAGVVAVLTSLALVVPVVPNASSVFAAPDSDSDNVIENSSFEVGSAHGWGLAGIQKFPLDQMIDSTTAAHGSHSVRLPYDLSLNAQVLVSPIYRLKPSTDYVLSLYMKSDLAGGRVAVRLENTHQVDSPPVYFEQSFSLSGSWQRYSLSARLDGTGGDTYQVKILPGHQGYPGKSLWVDAVQLQQGTLTPYSPRADVECGLVTDKPGNVFFEDEAVSANMLLFNNSMSATDAPVEYRVYDHCNKLIRQNRLTRSVGGGQRSEQIVDMSPGRRGAFRIVSWIDGRDGTVGELNFSVIPRPRALADNRTSIFGAHVPFSDYYLSQMQKAGFKWNRTLSTGRQFRWSEVEPQKGVFVWKDAEMALARKYGMQVLGTVGNELVHVPAWAQDGNGLPKLDEWDAFVYAIVDHYKDDVDYWEVWNEPDTEGGLGDNPAFYAQLLKTAHQAIKRADPDAKVVGMAAYYHSYVQSVVDAVGPGYADLWSSHRYPPVTPSHTSAYMSLANAYNKEAWNSETGAKTDTFYQTLLWEELDTSYARPSDWTRDYQKRTEWQVENFAETIGMGFRKYFYYDARNTTAPDFLTTYSLFEYDGSLRPKGVAFSVLSNLFDEAVGRGQISLGGGVNAYLFDRKGVPLLIVFPASEENSARRMLVGLPPADFAAYDLMGNPLPRRAVGGDSEYDFARSPIYVEGVGISGDQLVAGIRSVAAVADTAAPDISLASFPTGAIKSGSDVVLRWAGNDNVSLSTRGQPTANSIQYSHRLAGYTDTWSAWQTPSRAVYGALPTGEYTFELRAKDAANNQSTVLSCPVHVGSVVPADTSPPVTTLASDPTAPNGDNGWYRTAPQINVTPDESATRHAQWDSTSTAGWITNPGALTAPEGVHMLYYYSVDAAGNAEVIKSRLFKVDTEVPADPSVTSVSHTTGVWSNNKVVEIGFAGAHDDASGVDGYSVAWSLNAPQLPDTAVDLPATATSSSSPPLGDGMWYFSLRTKDFAGNWTSTLDLGPFKCDATPPNDPNVTSPTHGNPAAAYANNDATFIYAATDAASGVTAYTAALDQNPATVPGATGGTSATSVSYSEIADGTWYFHVRAKDAAQNWGPATHFRINVDTTGPQIPTGLAATPGDGQVALAWSNPTTDFAATCVLRSTAGFAASPAPLTNQTVVYEGTASSYLDRGLVNDTSYHYTVFSCDAAGNWSGPATASVTPLAPVATVPTAITLYRSKSLVAYGGSVTLSGYLATADTPAIPLQTAMVPLQLQRRTGKTSWATVKADLFTDASGFYSYTFKPTYSASYRVVWAGDGFYAPAASPTTSVSVRSRTSLRARSNRLSRGATLLLYGGIAPRRSGKVLRVYSKVGRTWRLVGRVRTNRYGRYFWRYRMWLRGVRYFRVYTPWDTRNGASYSRYVRILVH